MKKIYCIWIGGIGVSALARYYLSIGWTVLWSDDSNSSIIENLQKEGAYITIGQNIDWIDESISKVVYSEAIPENHPQRIHSMHQNIQTLSYPQAIGEITQDLELISIAGTHGKSTTTTLLSLILKASELNFCTIVGTLVPDFWGKNFFYRNEKIDEKLYFVLESCEYKWSFLNYKPKIWIITNLEADHLDYYKNIENYTQAFQTFLDNIRPGGFAVINMEDEGSKKLKRERTDISYVEMYKDYYLWCWESYNYRDIQMQVPWDHVLMDAKLAYAVWFLCNAKPEEILWWLKSYTWTWRRMETIGKTHYGNILMSDYGHHPTEILVTTKALKEAYPEKKIYCVFQPHQYSRTIELIEDFKKCFIYCDTLVIPNIYASRDSEENMKKLTAESFVWEIHHKNKFFGEGFENTLRLIHDYDSTEPSSSIILLMGAGDIDSLRNKIETSPL